MHVDTQVAMQFLNETLSMAYHSKPLLLSMLIFRMIKLSIDHGTCELSSIGFCGYGALLVSDSFGDFDGGYRYGQIGVDLMRKFKAEHVRKSTSNLFIIIFP